MVVRQRQINGLVETNEGRDLPIARLQEREKYRRGGKDPKVPKAHKS